MPKKYQCNSCRGIYSDTNTDGTPYYHACLSSVKNPRNENVNSKDGTMKLEGKGRTELR